jgi:hypothetical protein
VGRYLTAQNQFVFLAVVYRRLHRSSLYPLQSCTVHYTEVVCVPCSRVLHAVHACLAMSTARDGSTDRRTLCVLYAHERCAAEVFVAESPVTMVVGLLADTLCTFCIADAVDVITGCRRNSKPTALDSVLTSSRHLQLQQQTKGCSVAMSC